MAWGDDSLPVVALLLHGDQNHRRDLGSNMTRCGTSCSHISKDD